jgi:crossover junction endodeoxyribonuclease RusA
VITLAWPPRELHPNARPHHYAKAKAAKAYRNAAYWLCFSRGVRQMVQEAAPCHATISFYPPDKRKRDLDGMLSSIKAGLDGICDAYAMNDYDINPITIMSQPHKVTPQIISYIKRTVVTPCPCCGQRPKYRQIAKRLGLSVCAIGNIVSFGKSSSGKPK